ncbi:MAG: glycosyl hydrolase family 28-related protein [Thermoplasmata archaeon]
MNFNNFIFAIETLSLTSFSDIYAVKESYYPLSLYDPKAVYLTPDNFPVTPNKDGDDSEALQAAIDKVESQSRFGIVFIPEGEYEISKTIYIWKGIRLIGIGKKRPVFVLKENTPGFQKETKYIFHFVSEKPKNNNLIRDANPGTFYSAISNVDIVIKDGNPSAVAIRSHFAQHCYISHVDFFIGNGKAGIEEIGNEIEDCSFYEGDYGIIATKTSPSWPFLMVDCHFIGQKKSAIKTEEAGFTIVRSSFKDLLYAVEVNPDRFEKLFMIDSYFDNIKNAALIISDEFNACAQYNLKNIICNRVPILATFRKSGKKITVSYDKFIVKDFCHGLQIADLGYHSEIKTTYDIKPIKYLEDVLNKVKSDIPKLPQHEKWINIISLGAKGDGITDDTRIIQDAVNKYDVIYFPTGRYIVKETINLKPKSVLIGLNPITTQIVLSDKVPQFCGIGSPKPVIVAPKKGNNIITGIGIDVGAYNERAVGIKWMADSNSMINDVRFLGGHGTYNSDGSPVPVYNEYRNGDPYKDRDWDSQYWSLWITDGGGTFKNIWTPNTFAQAGIYISNTTTSGRIYAMSVEHHVRNEVIIRNVSNWKIFALQTEEESAESHYALPVRIDNSKNILFANLYLYRVIRMISPYPYGVVINSSSNIEFCGIHVYSPTKFSFDNTVYYQDYNYQVREREIAKLIISGKPPIVTRDGNISQVVAYGKKVEKVIGGFEFIDGATVDDSGNVYFVDSRWKNIYCWSPYLNKLILIKELLFTPSALIFDNSRNLIVTSSDGKVYSLNLSDSLENNLIELKPVDSHSHNAKIAIWPAHRWRDEHDFLNIAKKDSQVTHSSYTMYVRDFSNPFKTHYVSPDESIFIPKCNDLRRVYSLRKAIPGKSFFMCDEFAQKTYRFFVNQDGTLSNPELFAENGELDVAVDENENVYIPAGNLFVYDSQGKLIEEINIPERPANVVFGGKDMKTLFITARTTLYKIEIKE